MEDEMMRTKDRVREYADKHPTATVREIQTALGLSSPSVVQFHLKVDSKDNIIEAKDKRIAELEAALLRYRALYDMWGMDDETDSTFAKAYEAVRLSDGVPIKLFSFNPLPQPPKEG